MSLGNTTETDVITYIFDTTAPAWAANANFFVALHTADPGEAGTAITSEAAYTSYARVSISRTTGFTITGNQAQNAGLIQFPTSTGAGSNVTHMTIVDTASGAGQIIARASLSAAIPTTVGVQPQFAIGTITFSVD